MSGSSLGPSPEYLLLQPELAVVTAPATDTFLLLKVLSHR